MTVVNRDAWLAHALSSLSLTCNLSCYYCCFQRACGSDTSRSPLPPNLPWFVIWAWSQIGAEQLFKSRGVFLTRQVRTWPKADSVTHGLQPKCSSAWLSPMNGSQLAISAPLFSYIPPSTFLITLQLSKHVSSCQQLSLYKCTSAEMICCFRN